MTFLYLSSLKRVKNQFYNHQIGIFKENVKKK